MFTEFKIYHEKKKIVQAHVCKKISGEALGLKNYHAEKFAPLPPLKYLMVRPLRPCYTAQFS